MHKWVVYLQLCNGMSHLWGSLLAEVDQADVTCHMVPMMHGGAEDWVQFQLLSQQLHLYNPQHQSEPDVRAATDGKHMGKKGIPNPISITSKV